MRSTRSEAVVGRIAALGFNKVAKLSMSRVARLPVDGVKEMLPDDCANCTQWEFYRTFAQEGSNR